MGIEIAQIDHRRNMRSNVRALFLTALLVTPFAVSACSHAATPTGSSAQASAHATMQAGLATNATGAAPRAQVEVREAAWASRPGYTGASVRTMQAYRYALDHHDVLEWLPCYCGCGAMGHGSNLDCYFEPRSDGAIRFEEHASYCTICVDITLKAQELLGSGVSLPQVRDAIDAQFGDVGPGTDTERPVS
jgi:hypothetical protein